MRYYFSLRLIFVLKFFFMTPKLRRYLIGGAAAGVLSLGAGYMSMNSIGWDRPTADPVLIKVPAGTAGAKIADIMQKEGLDVNSLFFRLKLRLDGGANKIQAGYYQIKKGQTVSDVVTKLTTGDAYLLSWRLADGATWWEMRQSLDNTEGLKHDTREMSNDEILFAIGAKDGHMEGLFAPNTYNFHADLSDLKVLKKAYELQQKILTHEWSNRGPDCAVKTPYEALILASIVEREVGRPEDRFIVAGIFTNRLKIRMPLQTDPTVIYGEGEKFEGRLRRKHLTKKTAYNTYTFIGLPPTPIGMPTQESIHAVLHPAKTDYLYFINKDNGDLVPSKTLEEHNRAVDLYIRKKGQ